jgi:hypothetical protein
MDKSENYFVQVGRPGDGEGVHGLVVHLQVPVDEVSLGKLDKFEGDQQAEKNCIEMSRARE